MICEINLLMVAEVLKMYKTMTMVDGHLCNKKKRKEKKLAPIGYTDTHTHTPNNTNNR
jgi:hypothetical protein